jgi:hypothetical protein
MGPNLHLVKWCGHGNVFQQAKADENMNKVYSIETNEQ